MGSLEKSAIVLRAGLEFLSGRRLSAFLMEAVGRRDKALRDCLDRLELDEEIANGSEEEVTGMWKWKDRGKRVGGGGMELGRKQDGQETESWLPMDT